MNSFLSQRPRDLIVDAIVVFRCLEGFERADGQIEYATRCQLNGTFAPDASSFFCQSNYPKFPHLCYKFVDNNYKYVTAVLKLELKLLTW